MSASTPEPMTREEFEALPALSRGYIVYMLGARDDQPNVPDEQNPYPTGTPERDLWEQGQVRASIEVLDAEP